MTQDDLRRITAAGQDPEGGSGPVQWVLAPAAGHNMIARINMIAIINIIARLGGRNRAGDRLQWAKSRVHRELLDHHEEPCHEKIKRLTPALCEEQVEVAKLHTAIAADLKGLCYGR